MPVTTQHLREILDELEIFHSYDKETNRILFYYKKTEPFQADYKIIFTVSEERKTIQANGILCEKDLDDKDDFKAAYLFCNQWQTETFMPKVMVNPKGKFLICEWTWDTDFEICDEALKMIVVNFVKCTEMCIRKAVEEGIYLV